jgi:hypothetical protein
MGRNVIVSEETVRDLLEAHASLSAWYHQLWSALRAGQTAADPPSEAARAAFVERLATDFPEVARVARSIQVPRLYVPALPAAPSPMGEDGEQPTLVEPAPARLREAKREGDQDPK